jgi:GNAT superfamily N-acetyltransferase
LIAEPSALEIPVNSEVSVVALTSQNLEDWLKVQASAWGVPPPGISHIRGTMSEALAKGQPSHLNFLAYHEGKPVASAALRFFDDYAFLMGAAVNPEMRGRGVYRTLLAHRLKVIETRGLPAVIHCLEHTSAPICLKLGFEKVCEIQSFEP